ncbi:MAG: hypothetical protein ACTSRZ_16585 [Promethearchaeota archaeon]
MSESLSKWNVSIEMGENNIQTFELYDLNEFIGEYYNLQTNYFDDLLDSVKISKNYVVKSSITKVTFKGEDWTVNPWILVLALDKKKGLPFWFLFKKKQDLSGNLVAIGPESFLRYAKENKNIDEDLKKVLDFIIFYRDKFSAIIAVPKFLTEEVKKAKEDILEEIS